MRTKTKVMLVDDSPVSRERMAGMLEYTSDMELIGQFGAAEAALRSLQNMATCKVPHLVLLELRLPGKSGLEALPYFKQSIPDIKIIILTQSAEKVDVMNAIDAGIDGYLLKSTSEKKIIENIQLVINGGISIDSAVAGFLFDSIKKTLPEPRKEVNLSNREFEVLCLIAEGMMMNEIATHLGLSLETIKTYYKHIYEKFEVKNAPAAIHKAHRAGILSRHVEGK